MGQAVVLMLSRLLAIKAERRALAALYSSMPSACPGPLWEATVIERANVRMIPVIPR